MNEAPTSETQPWKPRIWALSMAFTKAGAPSVGTFGKSIHQVVIMPVATWTRLCKEHPSLATQEFEVGSYD